MTLVGGMVLRLVVCRPAVAVLVVPPTETKRGNAGTAPLPDVPDREPLREGIPRVH